jgi:inner membrane protein
MGNALIKKVIMIFILIILLMIPLMMIKGVVKERSNYREEARDSIAQSWTSEQKILGPLLVLPYKERVSEKVWDEKLERYEQKHRMIDRQLIITPEKLDVEGKVTAETRQRGIYSVPVYHSELAINGHFNLSELGDFAKRSEHAIEWQSAYVSVMISDVRGVEQQPVLKWGDEEIVFVPNTQIEGMNNGMHAPLGKWRKGQENAAFDFKLKLNGMDQLDFSPIGNSTHVRLKSNWPDPSFVGRYLPASRQINAQGFEAVWNLSSFASGLPQNIAACQLGICTGLLSETFGVKLFNSVDIYQQSERSVKYALLFIGLTFVSFFLYEIMKGLRLHPMQYLLVGLELSVFYLLLISLSEHMAFTYAYSVATLASTLLISFYITSVLKSAKHGGMIGGGLLLLYAMLYSILRSEDNSLLMGSLLIFGMLSLVMVTTRRLDWYAVFDNVTEKVGIETTETQSAVD